MAAEVKEELSGLKLMRSPFPENQVNQLPKPTKAQNTCPPGEKRNCSVCGGWHHPRVVHLSYVGHAAITDRLLDVDPNWSWEPMGVDPMGLPVFDASGGLWIKLTVNGVTRIGYGNAEHKEHMDVGAREKEAIGDAIRNASMRFGAALYLWHKGDLHAHKELEVIEGEFVEPAQLTAAKEEPKVEAKVEPKPAPKEAKAPAEKKPAAAKELKINGSAKPSEPTTEAKIEPNGVIVDNVKGTIEKASQSAEAIVAAIPPEKLNSYLTAVMKQMTPPWKYINIRKFYADHFDASVEIPAGDEMEPAMKRAILAKIIEVEKVAPF